jgi:hypothetical protein
MYMLTDTWLLFADSVGHPRIDPVDVRFNNLLNPYRAIHYTADAAPKGKKGHHAILERACFLSGTENSTASSIDESL